MVSERLTVAGLNARLIEFDKRLGKIELDHKQLGGEHQALALADAALQRADGETAAAVGKLADAINHPKTGLIVELDRFRLEVREDRRVLRAYIAGAVAVISAVWAVLLIFAPAIQKALGIT